MKTEGRARGCVDRARERAGAGVVGPARATPGRRIPAETFRPRGSGIASRQAQVPGVIQDGVFAPVPGHFRRASVSQWRDR